MQINSVISVCTAKDIKVWEIASRHIVQNIDSCNYCVIVPHNEVDKFRAVTTKEFQVFDENLVLEGIDISTVRDRMPLHTQD
jgi:hypothetical protein